MKRPPDNITLEEAPSAPLQTSRWCLLLIPLLTLLLYGWTLNYPMEFDDFTYLCNNPLVVDSGVFGPVSDMKTFARKPQELGLDPDLAVNFVLRPVAYASFKLNYLLDGFNPAGYRAFNLLIHALNGVLIFLLLKRLLLLMKAHDSAVSFVPAVVSLLFTVHPLATESVTYIAQRFTSLGAAFYLGALLLWFRSGGFWSKAGSVVLTLAGMLTNETTFTLPIMVLIIQCLLLGDTVRVSVARAWPLLLTLPLIPSLVLWLSWGKARGHLSLLSAINITNPVDDPMSHTHWLMTQAVVVVVYLAKLIVPSHLSLDPGWRDHTSMADPFVLGALMLLGLLVSVTFVNWLRKRSGVGSRVLLLGVAWFFIIISISSALVPLPDNMAEHRTYLPSVGVLLVVAWALHHYIVSYGVEASSWRYNTLGLAVLVLSLSLVTMRRNYDWRSSTALWQDTVEKSPHHFRPWCNLAAALAEEGQWEPALSACKRALKLEPRHYVSQLNHVLLLNRMGRHQEVLDALQTFVAADISVMLTPDMISEGGAAMMSLGHHQKANQLFFRVLERQPAHRPSHLGLAKSFAQTGAAEKALHHLGLAANLAPLDEVHLRLEEELRSHLALAVR
jgi:protein O-mannosyl-transferase